MSGLNDADMAAFSRIEAKIRARFYKKRFIADIFLTLFALSSSMGCFIAGLFSYNFNGEHTAAFKPFMLGALGMFAVTIAMIVLSIVHCVLWVTRKN